VRYAAKIGVAPNQIFKKVIRANKVPSGQNKYGFVLYNFIFRANKVLILSPICFYEWEKNFGTKRYF
jgi:hypothetical protein